MSTHPTEGLAAFLAALHYESLPAALRERVTDIVLDTVASAVAGRHGDEMLQVEAAASAMGGPKTSTVIAGPPTSLAGATLVNGYQVAGMALCDIHQPTSCEVTPEVVPPALAIAEQRGASGRDLLVAVAAGLEAAVRVGIGMRYPSMRLRGWHSPGVIGPFGGASAVSRLLGLDARRFRNALSLAGTQSAGTFAHWGTPTINFQQARGGLSGLLAALLAEQGFPAGPEILNAEHGGLFRLYSDGGDSAAVVAGLGETWMLETISLRPWPAASPLQSVVGAVLAMADEHDLRFSDVERIDVDLSKAAYEMHGAMPWDSKVHALQSAPYVTGIVLQDRRCWLEQFLPERLGDPALGAFIRERVRIGVDEAVTGAGAKVTLRTTDGRLLTERRDYPHGDAVDPLSREEIVAKFRASADGLLEPDETERAIDMLANLADLPRVADLCATLSRAVPAVAGRR